MYLKGLRPKDCLQLQLFKLTVRSKFTQLSPFINKETETVHEK